MKLQPIALLCFFILGFDGPLRAQELVEKARIFLGMLDSAQRAKTYYPFESEERYRYHFVPQDDRKGISVNELNTAQRTALTDLLKICLSGETVQKVKNIMQLDTILKAMEHRKPEDHYRDPGKYFVTIFGLPAGDAIWGWRFEGHHVAFHFSVDKGLIVAGTPAFLGSNPAVVQEGPSKNEEVLKDETDMGLDLLRSLSAAELKKALIDSVAPGEIVTGASRKAMIANPVGVRYDELSGANQQRLLQLIGLYVHRYTKVFAEDMLKEIQAAGLDNLRFAWAGFMDRGLGKPHYYRIQGPTMIIEYDNTQNNANHVHTVVRDLTHDFGGDLLLEHYRKSH